MIGGVHISSSEMVINKDDGKKSNLPRFVKNQVVKALVKGALPDGKTELIVNGRTISAKTAMLLSPGEEVELKVVQEKDAIVLKLIGPARNLTPGKISSLISSLSKNDTFPDISEKTSARIGELLSSLSLKSGKPDIDFLPRLIENSGLMFEKKISRILTTDMSGSKVKSALNQMAEQDLKPVLMQELLSAGPDRSQLMRGVAVFSDMLENLQLLNHQQSDSGRYILPFPIFGESAFRFGQLLIDTGEQHKKKDGKTNKIINVSFLLNMTQLGPMRADFSFLNQETSGRFLFCAQETCDYIIALLPKLKTQLARHGYQVSRIDVKVAQPEEVQPSSLINEMVKSDKKHVLNIVA